MMLLFAVMRGVLGVVDEVGVGDKTGGRDASKADSRVLCD